MVHLHPLLVLFTAPEALIPLIGVDNERFSLNLKLCCLARVAIEEAIGNLAVRRPLDHVIADDNLLEVVPQKEHFLRHHYQRIVRMFYTRCNSPENALTLNI